MTVEECEELRKKSLEEYKRLQKELDELLKKAMESSVHSTDLHNSIDAANQAAYDHYLKIHELNNAKSDAAYEEYLKTCDELDSQFNHGNGDMSQADYYKAREQAYQNYSDMKTSNDNASKKAYEDYKQIYQDNISNERAGLETQKQNTTVLSVPKVGKSDPKEKLLSASDKTLDTQIKTVTVQSKHADEIIRAFNKKFENDEWYKDNPAKQMEDGSISMSFKSDEDMASFFQDQAKEGNSFLMVDAQTNKVIAFSNGDGNLYKPGADGEKQLFTGGSLYPSAKELEGLPNKESFTMPPMEEQSSYTHH